MLSIVNISFVDIAVKGAACLVRKFTNGKNDSFSRSVFQGGGTEAPRERAPGA